MSPDRGLGCRKGRLGGREAGWKGREGGFKDRELVKNWLPRRKVGRHAGGLGGREKVLEDGKQGWMDSWGAWRDDWQGGN